MSSATTLHNSNYFVQEIDGAVTFTVSPAADKQKNYVFDVHDDGEQLVIEACRNDPGTVLEANPEYPDTWKKARFAELGKTPEPSLVAEAEERFGLSYQEILKTKRTIGAMTTLAFVFDDASVKIAVVQRTSKGPDGTPNMGALSRFG